MYLDGEVLPFRGGPAFYLDEVYFAASWGCEPGTGEPKIWAVFFGHLEGFGVEWEGFFEVVYVE